MQLTLSVFRSFNGSSSVLAIQRILAPDGHIAGPPVLERKHNAQCPTATVL
jgi:hypothetical protein